ncbi:MAG: hypothetical protein ACTS3R_16745 [Inquilinaceae bacterium]
MDFSKRQFTSREVREIVDIGRIRFDQFMARKYLDLGDPPGQGRERQFTFQQLLKIVLFVKLQRLGLSPTRAARYVQNPHDDLSPLSVYQDGIRDWLIIHEEDLEGYEPRLARIVNTHPAVNGPDDLADPDHVADDDHAYIVVDLARLREHVQFKIRSLDA